MITRIKTYLRTWYTDVTTPQQRVALSLLTAALRLGRFEWIVLGVLSGLYLVAVVAFAVWSLA